MSTESRGVWQARLGAVLDPRAAILNDSLPVDHVLWPEELALSRAYAAALEQCGELDAAGVRSLNAACDQIEQGLRSGDVKLEGEDVHGAVESLLIERAGDAARRLHTGRSRNDQVATLMRMRIMALCDAAVEHVRELERALLQQALATEACVVAGQTHLQPAQPVSMAHLWLAHVAALERDETRFHAARQEADCMPLGASAVAGTPLIYDRAVLAMHLGFSRSAGNSVDAVGDRDFALSYLQAGAQLGIHLSRLAEDLVLWCTPGYGWYAAPDGFSTGSSLLPQKRNPDLFELARGKAGRLLANAQQLAVVLKGLPSSYQKDLQEDKDAVFDTACTIEILLPAIAPAIQAMQPKPDRMASSLTPDLLAVELADALVERGVPFRDAHAQVGALWHLAETQGVAVAAIDEALRLDLSPHFTDEVIGGLSFEGALARRNQSPGTGRNAVASEIERAESRLGLAGASAPEPSATRQPPVGGSLRAEATPPVREDGITIRAAKPSDVQGIALLMADYIMQGELLPRSVGELFHAIREFHVAVHEQRIVACGALRLLWGDLGEVRSLAVHPDFHGRGLGAALVCQLIEDAKALSLPRLIALTREVAFFERVGFSTVDRELLPRKVWADCIRCPRRHACDETAMLFELVPGAGTGATSRDSTWSIPLPRAVQIEPHEPMPAQAEPASASGE